jgi:hypothetical protein
MKLSEILSIVGYEPDLPSDVPFGDLLVLRNRFHWGDAEGGWLYDGDVRKERLHGDMIFDEPFMLLDDIGHYPMLVLSFPESLAALEGKILDDSGIFNPFTSAQHAFIDGTLRRFECTHIQGGVEVVLDKEVNWGDFSNEYPGRRLRWL